MHILQSPEWAKFRRKIGLEVLEVKTDHESLFVSLHQIPYTPWKIAYLPRPNPKLLTRTTLEKIIKKIQGNTIFLRIEPDLDDNFKFQIPNSKFQKGSQVLPQYTFHVDLNQPEEKILKNMHPKTRYDLRLAQKKGVKIFQGQNQKDLQIFLKLQRLTAKRQNFSVKPDAYFQTLWKILKPYQKVHLLIATLPHCQVHQSCHLGAVFLFSYQDTIYYPYGGSSQNHKGFMVNYLLHWEAIKLGKKLGAKTYDFWGAYKFKPQPSDPWWGIYRFKKGFGGHLIEYPPSLDIILKPQLYPLYQLAQNFRPFLQKLKFLLIDSL